MELPHYLENLSIPVFMNFYNGELTFVASCILSAVLDRLTEVVITMYLLSNRTDEQGHSVSFLYSIRL